MTQAFVGIGSNLDDPRRHVLRAFEELAALPRTQLVRKSSLYRSAPMGHTDQPDYLNAVAELQTGLTASELLFRFHTVEARHHRQRLFPNAPRTLDLDLLLFGQETIGTPSLEVPHPRMHQRAFVLEPLLEIAPDVSIPGKGLARDLRAAAAEQRVERID